jgi:hypothetical protein
VPNEFKARNQTEAVFESVLFWWSTINKCLLTIPWTLSKECWVWRPKADEEAHPPWRAISFLHPEELEACILAPREGVVNLHSSTLRRRYRVS